MRSLPEANFGSITDREKEGYWETDKPMNKNLIEGRYDATSLHQTAKSTGLVVEVNAAVVPGSNVFLPGDPLAGKPDQGVGRGHSNEQRAGG